MMAIHFTLGPGQVQCSVRIDLRIEHVYPSNE